MKVILLEELKGKGGEGDVIDVAQGFAENHLFPKGIAIPATPGNLKQLEQRMHNIEKRELARTTDAETLREALDGKRIVIKAKSGDEGQLFGSVTNATVAEEIASQLGPEIDRKRIDIKPAIKTLGEHPVNISLYREVTAELIVVVEDIDAEAPAAVEAGEVEDAETAGSEEEMEESVDNPEVSTEEDADEE